MSKPLERTRQLSVSQRAKHIFDDDQDYVYCEADSQKISSMRRQGMMRKAHLLKDLTPLSRKKQSSLQDSFVNRSFAQAAQQPRQLISLRQTNKRLQSEIVNLKQNIEELVTQNTRLKLRMKTGNLTIENSFSKANQQSSSHNLVGTAELHKVSEDAERLLSLLRKTAQYKQFVIGQQGAQLTFLRTMLKNRKKNCSCNQSTLQRKLWSSKDVYLFFHSKLRQWGLRLERDQIQQTLSTIDQIYEAIHSYKMGKVQKKWNEKVEAAKRSASELVSFQVMQLKKFKERESLKKIK